MLGDSGEGAVEVVDHGQEWLEETIAQAIELGLTLVGDSPAVVAEVRPLLAQQVDELVRTRSVTARGGVRGRCVEMCHGQCSPLEPPSRRSGGPYGRSMYSTEGRRWAVCG